MAIVPSTSRSAEDPISASEIQRTPYDRSDRNLDTIPPHQLQPCLKSICEELKRLRHIVEVLQAEQKKMAGSVTKFLNLPFPLKLVPLKRSFVFNWPVLFCNNVRRDPSKSDINDMLGRVMGVDAVIPHKLQKALKFCNKKLADMQSEERRRMFTFQLAADDMDNIVLALGQKKTVLKQSKDLEDLVCGYVVLPSSSPSYVVLKKSAEGSIEGDSELGETAALPETRGQAAQQRKEDKKKAEKEKILNEPDPEKTRKWEEEEHKALKKMGPIMKQIKIKG
eukprot:Em0004g215a